MAVRSIDYGPTLSADTAAHPSQSIWRDCPIAAIQENMSYGRMVREDFTTFAKSTAVSSNVGRYVGDNGNLWVSYEDTSCTLLPLTAFVNGVVRLSVTNTGSKAVVMELGNSNATATKDGPFMYTDGSGPKLWFECRVRLGTITDSIQNMFIGLAQSGVAVVPAAATSATTIYDSGTTAGQVDHIGFRVMTGSGNGALILASYGKVSVGQTILGIAQTAADTSTWYKLGFMIEPQLPQFKAPGSGIARKKGRFFVNGVEIGALSIVDTSAGTAGGNPDGLSGLGNPNYATATTGAAYTGTLIAGTAFPTAKQLTPAVHLETVTTTAATLDVDFIQAAQVYSS